MQPNQQPDNVWISREEYDRLRQQAVGPQMYTTAPAADPSPKTQRSQIVIGVLVSIGLLLAMTVPLFKIISLPVLLILLIFMILSFNDRKKSRRLSQPATASPQVAREAPVKKRNR